MNIPLMYRGHVVMDGSKRTMAHYVSAVNGAEGFRIPTVLTIGSSMSSGKTTSVKAVIRALKKMSLTVAAAKLTGAARWSDALAMGDAGVDYFFDFVDAGLSSSIGPPEDVGPALRALLQRIQSLAPDVFVAEVGASCSSAVWPSHGGGMSRRVGRPWLEFELDSACPEGRRIARRKRLHPGFIEQFVEVFALILGASTLPGDGGMLLAIRARLCGGVSA